MDTRRRERLTLPSLEVIQDTQKAIINAPLITDLGEPIIGILAYRGRSPPATLLISLPPLFVADTIGSELGLSPIVGRHPPLAGMRSGYTSRVYWIAKTLTDLSPLPCNGVLILLPANCHLHLKGNYQLAQLERENNED